MKGPGVDGPKPRIPVDKRAIILALLVAGATLAVFWPVTRHRFLSWDDNTYVTQNRALEGGLTTASAAWAVTAVYGASWHPLTWMSHALDISLFGLDPAGHHAMSLLLHAAAAALLLLILSKLTAASWPSALVAALFALHPLHVESVAWLSERKDVLCALFSFLAIWWYLRYLRRPGPGRYSMVVLGTALALAAKGTAVTLPLLLLLLDWWPLGRVRVSPDRGAWRRAVKEKIPLLAMALGAGMLNLHAQAKIGAVEGLAQLPLAARLLNALVSWATYLWKTVWPTGLSFFYPYPLEGQSFLAGCGAALALGGSLAGSLFLWRRRPYLIAGWLWYTVTLLPVIGILQLGSQAMADRYTYLPLVGFFMAVSWSLAAWATSGRKARLGAVACLVPAALLLAAAAARGQLKHWRDDEALFSHAIAVDPRNWMAHFHLAESYRRLSMNGRAAEHYRATLEALPDHAEARGNFGVTLMLMGRTEEGLSQLRQAAALRPRHAPTWFNLGLALRRSGRIGESQAAFEKAVAIDPSLSELIGAAR